MSETKRRAKYTLEFKMDAVWLVKGGQACSATAEILGILASLENWVRLNAKGQRANGCRRGMARNRAVSGGNGTWLWTPTLG